MTRQDASGKVSCPGGWAQLREGLSTGQARMRGKGRWDASSWRRPQREAETWPSRAVGAFLRSLGCWGVAGRDQTISDREVWRDGKTHTLGSAPGLLRGYWKGMGRPNEGKQTRAVARVRVRVRSV